jgi:hypothetical protein
MKTLSSSLERIEPPSGEPDLGIWGLTVKSAMNALRGIWGSYDYSPTTTGSINVSLFKVERRGKLIWFTLTFSGSGSGTISLPTPCKGNTAFASIGCNAYALDGESVIRYSNATGTGYISGAFKVG